MNFKKQNITNWKIRKNNIMEKTENDKFINKHSYDLILIKKFFLFVLNDKKKN